MLEARTMIAKIQGPVETTVGTEIVLMQLAAGECYGLGETGSDIWRQLAEPIAFSDLVVRLRAIYMAPEGVLESDVADLLEDLKQRKLVEFR